MVVTELKGSRDCFPLSLNLQMKSRKEPFIRRIALCPMDGFLIIAVQITNIGAKVPITND